MKRDELIRAAYGCSPGECEKIGRDAMLAYGQNKRNAGRVNIGWKITLPEWWSVWKKSGLWRKRRGQYGLLRRDKRKPFAADNVYVGNVRDARKGVRKNGTKR